MGSLRSPCIGIAAGLCLAAFPVRAQDSPDTNAASGADTFDSWLPAQRDGAGRACDQRAVEALEGRWVVACGESGVWFVRRERDGALVLVRTEDLGGPVIALFRREGRVWAEVLRREARDVAAVDEQAAHAAFPLSEGSLVPAPTRSTTVPRAEADPVRDRIEGRVTATSPGEVTVNLGKRHGLVTGERVELAVIHELDIGGQTATQREVVAVGVVSAASDGFARVKLGIGERVPLGALARPVDAPPSAKRAAPPRLGGLWHAGFIVRPFLALDEYGGGFLADASVGYRFEGALHVEAALSPFAYGTVENQPSVVPFGAFVKASYDGDLFELGLGIGAESVNDVPIGADPGSGILFVQHLRIGALDGLHFDVLNHAVLFHSEFEFSGLVMRGQIPVGRRFWLLFAGGGGTAGYAYGESGVRALMRGNGDRGSFFLTGTIGGVAVFQNRNEICRDVDVTFPCPEESNYGGPMIGAGGEWRF